MEQKIIQIGNSTGVILPKVLLEKIGLKPGSKVVIEQDLTGESLTISKGGTKTNFPSITPRFIDLLEKVNTNYGNALKQLAQK